MIHCLSTDSWVCSVQQFGFLLLCYNSKLYQIVPDCTRLYQIVPDCTSIFVTWEVTLSIYIYTLIYTHIYIYICNISWSYHRTRSVLNRTIGPRDRLVLGSRPGTWLKCGRSSAWTCLRRPSVDLHHLMFFSYQNNPENDIYIYVYIYIFYVAATPNMFYSFTLFLVWETWKKKQKWRTG